MSLCLLSLCYSDVMTCILAVSSILHRENQMTLEGSRAICQAEMGRRRKQKSWVKKNTWQRIFSAFQTWRIFPFFTNKRDAACVFQWLTKAFTSCSVITWGEKNWKKKMMKYREKLQNHQTSRHSKQLVTREEIVITVFSFSLFPPWHIQLYNIF